MLIIDISKLLNVTNSQKNAHEIHVSGTLFSLNISWC